MNERIKLLAEEANWWKPLGLPSDWNDGDYVVSPEQMEKFAELIIQKCIDICLTNSVSKDEARWAAGVCAFDIQEHFGVD